MQQFHRVALVGRPNVGKSTLFNRLIGARQAVVSDIAGTTRDRLERNVTWKERTFTLVDMAGLEPALTDKNEIRAGMQQQVATALNEASLIVWVVDRNDGVTHADELAAELLRRENKPVLIAVNKCDDLKHELAQYDFSEFGFLDTIPISALHDRGCVQLLDTVVANLVDLPVAVSEEADPQELALAIVGRPNVGKSTLLNALVNANRSLVSAEAGTTRDSVDTVIPASHLFGRTFTQWKQVRLIDTAGIRRRGKIDRQIEGWSVIRTLDAIDKAEVTLLLLDASEKLVHQDMGVAEKIVDAGRPIVLVMNKWDQVLTKAGIIAGTPEESELQEKYLQELLNQLPFMRWVQVIFMSALTKLNLFFLGQLVRNAYAAWDMKIEQSELDDLCTQLKTTPRLKNLTKITFDHGRPPVFHLKVNSIDIPHFSTRRYVENALRDMFNIGPTPIKIWVDAKPKKR